MKKAPLSDDSLSWILLIVLSLIWGSSFILIKKGLEDFSALEVASLRVIAAASFMFLFVVNKFARWSKQELFYLFIVGFSGSFFPAILFALAQTQISSSLSGVLNSMTPVSVLLVGSLFFSQKIKLFGIAGILLGLAGTLALITGFSFDNVKNFNFYALFVILATIFYGINLNIIKFKLKNVKAIDITGISVVMVLPLALMTLVFFTDFTSRNFTSVVSPNFLAIVFLGVVGTGVALMLFNKLVKLSSPLFTSSVTYLIPLVAVAWGLIDGERLYFYHYIGLVCIIMGIMLIHRKTSV